MQTAQASAFGVLLLFLRVLRLSFVYLYKYDIRGKTGRKESNPKKSHGRSDHLSHGKPLGNPLPLNRRRVVVAGQIVQLTYGFFKLANTVFVAYVFHLSTLP